MSKRRNSKKDRITKEDLLRIDRAVRREIAVEEGYYDGRNRPNVYVDRKKRDSKRACRGRVDY